MNQQFCVLFFLLTASLCCYSQGDWVRVTNNKTEDFHASFSPDGTKILFDSQQSGHNEIYLYDIATKETTQLTHHDSIRSDHPTWFPDSKHILFNYWKNGPGRYSMRIDGTERKLLIENAYAIASPKGDKVSFITNKNGDFDLYVIDSDGKNQRQLTDHKGDEVAMSWSRDERFIAFMCEIDKRFQICKIGADGSGYKQLTSGNNPCSEPHWSPNENRLAYSCQTDSGFVLCTMDENGRAKKELQKFKGEINNISWSPDGKKILCSVGSDAAEELMIVRVPDGKLTHLTNNNVRDTYPSWSPDGKKILFVSDMEGDLDVYYMQWKD